MGDAIIKSLGKNIQNLLKYTLWLQLIGPCRNYRCPNNYNNDKVEKFLIKSPNVIQKRFNNYMHNSQACGTAPSGHAIKVRRICRPCLYNIKNLQ